MAVNHWEIDFGNVDELIEKFKRVEGGAEGIINNVIHNDGIQMAIEHIQPDIPVSHWKNKVRNKKHARNVQNPQSSKKNNLAFTIRPKPKYNYLKYPDLGIGTSKKNQPQHFMRKGLEKASPKIIEKLNDRIDQHINQTLGGN